MDPDRVSILHPQGSATLAEVFGVPSLRDCVAPTLAEGAPLELVDSLEGLSLVACRCGATQLLQH